MAQGRKNTAFGHKMVEVTVCHPLQSDLTPQDDFDDPNNFPASDWRKFERSKLSVQVTTYLNLVIPYANAFLWWASLGKMSQERVAAMKNLRLAHEGAKNERRKTFGNQGYTLEELQAQAEQGNYVMPIRGAYSMRMHSNLSEKANLPTQNLCHVPFERK